MQFIFHDFAELKKARDKILLFVKEEYSIDKRHLRTIQDSLNDFFNPLKKDLSAFIEYPYVDKVYRDSYYNYFSTKYKQYHRDCIRISFFDSPVKEKDIVDGQDVSFLQENFRGYCVLRPTFPNIIGRNLISKAAFIENDFVICLHEENVLVNGCKLHIKGFPHSSQDEENITCAETTVWALMEYFGHKYAEYKPVLPSTIINKLDEYSDKRMLPSSGLTPEQISFALKDFGFGTMIYTEEDDKKDFLPNLSVYTESGFPFIATLENEKIAHAILVVGREKVCTNDMIEAFGRHLREEEIIPFSSIVKSYIVQDDNLHPYAKIPLDNPVIHYDSASEFADAKINAFVIPLYKKMYMEVQKARKFFEEIFKDPRYGLKTKQKHIFRMYMASSRSLKEHIGQQADLDPTLKNVLLSVAMPRFVWCGEYINAADAARRAVSSLIVLDATEAGENWADSFIFAAHKNSSLFYVAVDHTYKLIPLKVPFTGFLMYEHNLN